MLVEPIPSRRTLHNEDLVFIDTEFCPLSHEWLSLGAVMGREMFYAETGDPRVLELAELEFQGNPVGKDILKQLGNLQFAPGIVGAPAEMARAFFTWISLQAASGGVHICYDFALDIGALEHGLEHAGMQWPRNWLPCNLAILNGDAAGIAAREAAWTDFRACYGVSRHHALADAAALRAAYLVQSGK